MFTKFVSLYVVGCTVERVLARRTTRACPGGGMHEMGARGEETQERSSARKARDETHTTSAGELEKRLQYLVPHHAFLVV